jgi:hypothetical protein
MTETHRRDLTDVLLADDARANQAAAAIGAASAWPAVLGIATVWKVIPQLSGRLQQLRIRLPDEDTATLRREFMAVYARSAGRAKSTITAIQALAAQGIDAVAFKGVASMSLLYDGPRQRTIGDGDLLIRRHQLPEVLACLAAIGFARRGDETVEQYLNFVRNAPRFAGNQALALYRADGSEIDLHWEIAGSGLKVDSVLERAVTAPLLDSRIAVVAPRDGFLLTVHHAIREDLRVECVARDLLDVARWCQHLEGAGELASGLNWLRGSDALGGVLAVTALLASYDADSAVARVSRLLEPMATRAQRRSAALLQELFRYQLERGGLERDVLYLVHSQPWRQIVSGLVRDWSGYRASMQTLDHSISEEQPLPRRFAQLLRSIPGMRGLRLARELARVKYRRPETV